jgi:hypothetical protein
LFLVYVKRKFGQIVDIGLSKIFRQQLSPVTVKLHFGRIYTHFAQVIETELIDACIFDTDFDEFSAAQPGVFGIALSRRFCARLLLQRRNEMRSILLPILIQQTGSCLPDIGPFKGKQPVITSVLVQEGIKV